MIEEMDWNRMWMENLGSTNPEAEEVIRSHLSENLVQEDGVFWSKHEIAGAMICL
jgi:hypothetical protein